MPAEVKLPKNAPPALRDFVACRVDTLDLDPADTAWIPVPPELGAVAGAPTVTVEDGAAPGSIRVTAAWAGGYVSMTLEVSVVDGNLEAQAQGTLGEAMQGEIDSWLQGLNEAVRSQGKQFGEITLRAGKGTIRKAPIAAAPQPGAAAVAGGTNAPITPPAPVPTPTPPPPADDKGGCLRWLGLLLIGVIGAGFIGYGAVQLLDDDTAAPSSEVVDDEEPPPSDGEPAEEEPPAEPEEPAVEAGACSTGSEVDQNLAAAIEAAFAEADEEFLATIGGNDVWTDGALRVPCQIDGADLPLYLPCRAPFTCVDEFPAVYVPGGYPATEMPTSHNGSDPDAVTGEIGLSANQPFFFTSAADAVYRFTADCSGKTSTADGVPGDNGIVIFSLPLFQYGPCTATSLVETVPGRDPSNLPLDYAVPGGSWTVGPEEWPADVADLEERIAELEATTARKASWQAAQDAAGVLFEGATGGALPWGVECTTWLPAAAPEGEYVPRASCPTPPSFLWTGAPDGFTWGGGPALGFHGGFATGPPLAGTSEFLYGGEYPLFPCGPGQVAVTVCPEGGGALPDEPLVGVTIGLLDPVTTPASLPIEFDNGAIYTIQVEGGGAEQMVLVGPPGRPTTGHALIRDQAVTLLVAASEVGGAPSYRLGPDQPFTPIVPMVTLPGAEPAEESLDDFAVALSASMSSGDFTFALERLHPQVYEFYPTECPAYLEATYDPTFLVTIVDVVGEEPFLYQVPDGRSATIEDSTTVLVERTAAGQVQEATSHLVLGDDGEWQWLTFCVPPQS